MTGGRTLLVMIVLSVLWPLNPVPEPGDPYIIINKNSNTLAFIDNGSIVKEYPVATGRKEELTPEGEFTIVVKAVRPYYRKLDIKGGDPDNPLGSRWIGFDAENTNGRIYGIHGTNRSSSIGGYVSNGCVRMHNDDVNELFENVENGVKVWIESSSRSMEAAAKKRGVLFDRKPLYLNEDLKSM
ncbi:L,D-transpeptidase [Salibacterium qingdaonense]|uniref:L,D-transpeptidase catalytic domain n=1 Tax=Salibacterium qingdaonense TaxID=266892 RepID=A0A1I4JQW6_9BACI|nr:L,D-transpeptidase [Salibacterium qingdaonense]SFL68932.1 L,D-transpeptidase catalytic domain [Salibacterium qingdaonense]